MAEALLGGDAGCVAGVAVGVLSEKEEDPGLTATAKAEEEDMVWVLV